MKNKTKVVNIINNPGCDFYIDSPSLWENPFKIGFDGTKQEIIEKYKIYLTNRPDIVELAKLILKGKVLGCYCDEPCHGTILKLLVEE